MTLGEKLKTYRAEHNMTQEELAARLFVTRAAVSKWERDAGYPGIDSLKLIAKLMDCTLDELVSDDDVEGQKLRDKRASGRAYVCAVACFAVAVLFALLAYFLAQPLFLIGAGSLARSLSQKMSREDKLEERDERNQLIDMKSKSLAFRLTQGISFVLGLLFLVSGAVAKDDAIVALGLGFLFTVTISMFGEMGAFLHYEKKL